MLLLAADFEHCMRAWTVMSTMHAQGSCFNVRVSFSDEEAGLRFKPDEFRVTEALVINAVQGAVALLGSLHRLSHTRSFIPFYEGKPSSTRLHEVVRSATWYIVPTLSPLRLWQPHR